MGRYKLLSSLFSGKLETFAANKTPCSIIYNDEDNRQKHAMGLIVDLFERDNKEFVKLDNGVEIALGSIVNVDGISAVNFDNYC
ncbi:hypothetical protein [Solitalea longa]|nr:hypothetical protein [Solitalea longa]